MVLLLMTLVRAAPSPVQAQGARLIGASVERFTTGEGHLTAVNFRQTQVNPGQVGLDVAVGFVPSYLAVQALLLNLDAGIAYPMVAGPARLLIKGGPASFLGVGQDVVLYPGLQAGFGLAIPLERRCFLRLDLSRRLYLDPGEGTIGFWSIAIGLAAGPPR
jgi:hypothetical protein